MRFGVVLLTFVTVTAFHLGVCITSDNDEDDSGNNVTSAVANNFSVPHQTPLQSEVSKAAAEEGSSALSPLKDGAGGGSIVVIDGRSGEDCILPSEDMQNAYPTYSKVVQPNNVVGQSCSREGERNYCGENTNELSYYGGFRSRAVSRVFRFSKLEYADGTIPENRARGTPVDGLKDFLLDGAGAFSGNVSKCAILDGNVGNAFRLQCSPPPFKLYSTKPLDRECIEMYHLVIEAVDWTGMHKATTEVRVTVTNENDNRPVFNKPLYLFPIDISAETVIIQQIKYDDANNDDDDFNRYNLTKTKMMVANERTAASAVSFSSSTVRTVGYVTASDKDGDKVIYKLTDVFVPSNDDAIIIEPMTGRLLVRYSEHGISSNRKKRNDKTGTAYDEYDYEATVQAEDNGNPKLRAIPDAHVRVLFRIGGSTNAESDNNGNGNGNDNDNEDEDGDGDDGSGSTLSSNERFRRRATRAVRSTKMYEFYEEQGSVEGSVVFKLEKESERETFVLRYPNRWVTVDRDGTVRVKKKWDYEELGPDKTFDFWVNITIPSAVPPPRKDIEKPERKSRGRYRGRQQKGKQQQQQQSHQNKQATVNDDRGNSGSGGKQTYGNVTRQIPPGGDTTDDITDSQRIIIALKDTNDEVPYFINRPLPMQAVVQLNAPPNTPVFTLQARDPDTDASIHYFIVRDRTGGRFEVDERSGVIRTRGTDPFQLDMEYVLYVKAEDHGTAADPQTRKLQSTPDERLSIVGGKRPPQFYMQSYEAEIPENQRKDSDIIAVKAKSFADREIRYTLKAQGQGAGTFNIGPTSGIVKLAKELDFEDLRQPHVYSLIVTATEDSGGFSTSVELTIRVTDVNDNAPKFELPDYQAHNIEEDIPLGTSIVRVKATDADSGLNAEIEYQINSEHFTIDSGGVVRNNKLLDADYNNGYYEVIVTANDKGDPPLAGTSNIRIYTKNKNDEEPKFSQQVYTPNVDENAGPNTLVTTVLASDKDGDNVKFKFVDGDPSSSQFVIEEITGVIRLHSAPVTLDRDKYELNVTAIDDGSCCVNGQATIHTSTAVVVVFITDVNDNKPIFKDCAKYSPKISEGTPNGYEVIKVQAIDNDKGVNGQVKYSIVQQPNQKGTKFIVNEETGQIFSNKVFDREGDDGKFVSVTVKATDQGEPSLEGVCSFTVEILDINDNPPLFDRQKYMENVKQDVAPGTNILRVSASDEDADNNGAIVYSLSASQNNTGDLQYFEINPESGWIAVKKPLDKASYQFEVTAQDRGNPPLSRTVEVKIEVVNRANNPPSWDRDKYGTVLVKENSPVNTKVVSLKASSGIEGNPVVYYTLMPGSTAQTNKYHTFYLQQRQEQGTTWADIKVNHPLDYETIREYNLTIRVENHGSQQLASETTIHILIEDVNDEIPLFEEREQETVLEGEPIGTRVTQVKAVDRDGNFPNNEVYYSIVDSERNEGRDLFEINTRTGEIFTRAVFDRETQAAYAVMIEARDGAPSARPHSSGAPNSVTKFIRIGIADKNDNPPYFDKPLYEAEVDENEDIQHTVLTVTAKDLDESSRIRYEITSGNVGGVFAVKNMTGAIYVAGPLDYETRKRYELRLSASDNLSENHTTVVIHVKDVNDNPPMFERPTYRTQITEEDDRNLPKPVVRVNATDGDKDRPASIVYFLTGQGIDKDNPANSQFDVNRTSGEIYVLKPLDRDQPNGRPQWSFTVFAQDDGGEGLVGYADVQVNLKDINDNAPFFPQGIYYGNVTENGTAGMVVMTMSAIDYDDPNESTHAKLVYSIEKNVIEEETGSPIFEIEPETGVVKTAVCCLDRERTPDYSIQVVAMDGGGLKGTGTASIRVKDINDMPPQFTKDVWVTEVDETGGDVLPKSPILTVTVHDEDETNKFKYKVIENSGYGADKFTMVSNNDGTGSLKIAQPLDYEDQLQRNGFNFRIQVNDKGEDNDNDKYHVSYAWVKIVLRNINDNTPQFEKPNVEVAVYENASIGESLEVFKATDPDELGLGTVSFFIDRASDKRRQFRIAQDGTVTIQRSLDREQCPRHQVKILAVDNGIPPKTATATLTVVVQDVNDNAPKFLRDYRPVLPEHVSARRVIEILATDDDDRSKSNGPPFTFKLDPNADDVIRASFKVEHDQKGANGDGMAIVSSLRSFDREQQKEYLIPIVIRDSGNPAMSATSTLTVIIGDMNDNKMQPGSKEIHVYKLMGGMASAKDEASIGRVYVHDLDDWDLPDKTFQWEKQKQHPFFTLVNETGMIKMRTNIIKDGIYNLQFKVYDRKHTQSNIPANVTVYVTHVSRAVVENSASIRLTGITDEDFIRIWNYKTQSIVKSKMEYLREKLSQILNVAYQSVQIFSVQLKQEYPPVTDVRFSIDEHQNLMQVNGRVLMFREEIERYAGINITMVGINECLQEDTSASACEGSCANKVVIGDVPYMVNGNRTALVGIFVQVSAHCSCVARNHTADETCGMLSCMNGGRCVLKDTTNSASIAGATCKCPVSVANGPRCQVTSRSFYGDGWIWLPPIEVCSETHMSVEFVTQKEDGLIFYSGPIVAPEAEEHIVSDFISLELDGRGNPRFLIDFGSGTLELEISKKKSLADGQWHRIDLFWDTEVVRMIVDRCKMATVSEPQDGAEAVIFIGSNCYTEGLLPPFNEYLNLNAPFQVGGRFTQNFDHTRYNWDAVPDAKHFHGCIRNIYINGILLDLGLSVYGANSDVGCSQVENLCNSRDFRYRCGEHGICAGSLTEPHCECEPGWSGIGCSTSTFISTFNSQSYVKYALSFEPDRFSTQLQLRFRTRETEGELFRVSDQHNSEYAVLEIKNKKLVFRFNLNNLKTEEKELELSFVRVNDGQWHTALVSRYGSTAILKIDGGEGRRYNETFDFYGHQWLVVDKQEGIYAGGKAEYTGVRTYEVTADFQRGCLDDIRLEGKLLPLPPSSNGTQWGQATTARNVERGCASHAPSCKTVDCKHPLVCVDTWNELECLCGPGKIKVGEKKCVDKNECLDEPCMNGGTCHNLVNNGGMAGYKCICAESYAGLNCEISREKQQVNLSLSAVAAILVCVVIICVIALVYVILARSGESESNFEGVTDDDDMRQNIVNYNDEGGGESDITVYDIHTLRVPIGGQHNLPLAPHHSVNVVPFAAIPFSRLYREGRFMRETAIVEEVANEISIKPPDHTLLSCSDDLRSYASEGYGSVASSLSSLTEVTDDEDQEYDHLRRWGPKFRKLADMYNYYESSSSDERDEMVGAYNVDYAEDEDDDDEEDSYYDIHAL